MRCWGWRLRARPCHGPRQQRPCARMSEEGWDGTLWGGSAKTHHSYGRRTPTLKAQLRTTVARSVPAADRRCGRPPTTPCVMAPRPAAPCVGIAARRGKSNHALLQQQKGCARRSRRRQDQVSGCARDSGDLALPRLPRLPVLNPLAANPDSSDVLLAEATGSPSTSSLTVHRVPDAGE